VVVLSDNILELKNISKSFPGVKAIDDISLCVKKGSVHVIVGENGAGKSTLMKIINGVYKPDQGTMVFDGKEIGNLDPKKSMEIGISMIYQELNVIPEMSIAESIFLGREPSGKFKSFINNKQLYQAALEYLTSQNLKYNPAAKCKDLTVSELQIVEIIKAISCNAKLIIMDEPTSAITDSEVNFLFEKIQELKKNNVTIIYISHKLDEIFRIADYISVFRDGKHIKTGLAGEFDKNKIIALMVGRELTNIYPKETVPIGSELMRVEGLGREGIFENISFSVRKGEILGVSGLMGAGRTEIVRAIFGIDPKSSGKIVVEGKEVAIKNVSDAIEHGIVMLSENRRKYGFIPVGSVKENISLVALKYFFKSKLVKHKKEKETAQRMIAMLTIKTPTLDTMITNLSGGNQQKVVLAKWLLAKPKVLILDEPTRGIDVGAKFEIYKIMCNLAREGVAIIMISSELPELIGMSDRIIVISGGKLTGELNREEATQVKIMEYATRGGN
jgi:inositol transport system ATP-binding protein